MNEFVSKMCCFGPEIQTVAAAAGLNFAELNESGNVDTA